MKTEEQIRGLIADTESKLKQLQVNHQKMVEQFNGAVVQNQAEYNRLNGELAAYRRMLEEEPAQPEETPVDASN